METIASSKEEIFKRLRNYKSELEELGVLRLGLFGSFVRDEQEKGSDVDILVEFQPGEKTFDNLMGLASLLETILRRPVEVVTREALSPYIGPYILRETEYVPLFD